MRSSLLVGLGSGAATEMPDGSLVGALPGKVLKVMSPRDAGDKTSQRWPPCPGRLLEGRLILVILLSRQLWVPLWPHVAILGHQWCR